MRDLPLAGVVVSVRDHLLAANRVSVRDLRSADIGELVTDLLPADVRVSVKDRVLAAIWMSATKLHPSCYLSHSWHPNQVLPPWVREDLGAVVPKGSSI